MTEEDLEAPVAKEEEVDALNSERKKYKKIKKNRDLDSNANVKEVDTYAQHKNYAKGLMDLALLTANSNQLARYYTQYGFHWIIILLCLSLVIQVSYVHSHTIFSNFGLFWLTIFQIYEVKSSTIF